MVKDPRALVVHKEKWDGYFLFTVESPKIAQEAQPGQFIMVRVSENPYPLLRRPFSIHSRHKNLIEIFFQVSGIGTALLAQKKQGETLDILGPLGKGFRLDKNFKDKILWLVGGGRGIAPLYFLSQKLQSLGAKIKVFYGGKSLADLPLREKFERNGFNLAYSTDDGSFGFKGFISHLLEGEISRLTPAAIFACGPEAMMKKIAQIVSSKKIQAQFSLESQMGCGFGACWGCVKRIKREGQEGWIKICEEGPVFVSEEIIWPEEEK